MKADTARHMLMAIDVGALLIAACWFGAKFAHRAWWLQRFAQAGFVRKAIAGLGIVVVMGVAFATIGLCVFIGGLALDPGFMGMNRSGQGPILAVLTSLGLPVVMGGGIIVSEVLLLPLRVRE